jgi:hypothetical protein
MAQGGDVFAGPASAIKLRRKAMNSLFCSVERPFPFVGRVNEDVNTYVWMGSQGHLFGTTNVAMIHHLPTQQQEGGMTETYQKGTYAKSFYPVMFMPSAVKVQTMRALHPRVHHQIRWNNAVPKIVPESMRKPR